MLDKLCRQSGCSHGVSRVTAGFVVKRDPELHPAPADARARAAVNATCPFLPISIVRPMASGRTLTAPSQALLTYNLVLTLGRQAAT